MNWRNKMMQLIMVPFALIAATPLFSKECHKLKVELTLLRGCLQINLLSTFRDYFSHLFAQFSRAISEN